MKKTLLILCVAVVAISSCKKKSSSTVTPVSLPTYTVDGIHDIIITGNSSYMSTVSLPLTVQFQDSFQKQVTLSLTGLPSGIVIDTTWITTGFPTFSTAITFYDTSLTNSATTGTYPVSITATGAAGTKTFAFNLKVVPQTSCTDNIIGAYYRNYSSCGTSMYTDSVYADAATPNKIWFKNVGNTHAAVYGFYSCTTANLVIPSQTTGGYTYSGTGTASGNSSGSRFMNITLRYGTDSCTVNMQN